MYTSFFGLREKPFSLTPDPDSLYLSQSHKEALAHLTYGVESKSGFVLLTGEVGAGKTTLLRTLIRNLGESVLLSQVTNTRVTYKELLEMVLRDFGVHPRDMGKTALLSALNEFLIEQYRNQRNCVLVIDEAQNLGVPSLEGVRMLSNLETEKSKLLHTILVGQPGLRDLIDSPELEQLRQRITVRYHLGPLSVGEVGEYIRFRLTKVAADPDQVPEFPDRVVPKIHAATGGLPRLINVLCDTVLLHAYVADSRRVTDEVVQSAAEQIGRDQKGRDSDSDRELESTETSLKRRVAEIEGRLNSVVADVALGAAAAAASPPPAAREKQLLHRARQLRDLEQTLRTRGADLDKKETELSTRAAALEARWKDRFAQVEAARESLLDGVPRTLPDLKIHAYDPDPRIRRMFEETFTSECQGAFVREDFETFYAGLREGSAAREFVIAVLGSVQDDDRNAERLTSLAAQLPHVPRIYISDLDLSTVRRRMLTAGANYFLEKPENKASSISMHMEKIENLRSDLVRIISTIRKQFFSFLEHFQL